SSLSNPERARQGQIKSGIRISLAGISGKIAIQELKIYDSVRGKGVLGTCRIRTRRCQERCLCGAGTGSGAIDCLAGSYASFADVKVPPAVGGDVRNAERSIRQNVRPLLGLRP